MNNAEALSMLVDGKKITLDCWPNSYLYLDQDLCLSNEDGCIDYNPFYHNEDWKIYGEGPKVTTWTKESLEGREPPI